jgi:hypothetical protein
MPKPSHHNRRRRRSLLSAVVALMAAFALLLALPLTSLGAGTTLTGAIGGLLNGVTQSLQTTVQHVLAPASHSGTAVRPSTPVSHSAPQSAPSSAPASQPAAGSPPYTPPMYGTNPHGQGTVSAVGLNSSLSAPYTYAPGGSSSQGEIVVIGRGRSEQNANGNYDAQTTILGLFGNDLIPESANQGQSTQGPLNAVQTGVLDAICNSTGGALCLSVLTADDAATSSGANTAFELASAKSNLANLGLNVDAAKSDSSISTTSTCQTSTGDSSVANVALASGQVAGVSGSNEKSTACNNAAPTQTANSSVVSLGGTGVALPAAGCANGTPNTDAGLLGALLPIWCNADSTNSQGTVPDGVREALTVLGLQGATSALAKVTTAASESTAVAPPASSSSRPPGNGSGSGSGSGGKGSGGKGSGGKGSGGNKCTDSDHDCGIGPNGEREVCVNGVDPDNDGDCINATPTGEVTSTKASSSLPFTGENILEVVLAGLVLTGAGLGLRSRRGLKNKS